jgi:hypothetical protein
MLLATWMVMSLVSHVIIYYWGNIVMFTIGYLFGRMHSEESPKPVTA